MPANRARKPTRTTSRGEAFGNSRGTPTAASSRVIDKGSSRTPVAIADSPRATDRNRGMTKNRPACSRYWNVKAMRPPRRTGLRRRGRLMSGSLPCAMRWSSQLKNSNSRTHTGGHEPDHRRQAEPFRRVGLRLDESPRAGAQHPVDEQTETRRRQRSADEIELHAVVGRRVGDSPRQHLDDDDDQDLTGEHPAPRGVRREQPADERPSSHRDGTGRRHQPVGARPRRRERSWIATSATMAGRMSTAPSPSSRDQPSSNTGRFGARAVVSDPQP